MVRNNHPIPDRRFHSASAVVCVEGDKDLEEGKMMNDNRKQILAHQAIDDASNSVYYQQQLEQHRTMIGLLQAKVNRLETELADVTAQRDAWRKTACASAIAPERLKTVELTAEGQ